MARYIFLSLLVLVSCGRQAPQPDEKHANSFKLLNENNEESPLVFNGKSFSGALFSIVNNQQSQSLVHCSTSQILPGILVTNAHCFKDQPNLNYWWVAFYVRKNGRFEKRIVHPEQFIYLGNPSNDDVAILKIDLKKIEGWDSLAEKNLLPADVKDLEVKKQKFANILVMNPESYFVPGQKNALLSARARKVRCSISNQIPLIANNQRGEGQRTWSAPGIDYSRNRIYLDECTDYLYQGNSGGAIVDDNGEKFYGVFDSFASSVAAGSCYFGNRQIWFPIAPNLNKYLVFGYALTIEASKLLQQ